MAVGRTLAESKGFSLVDFGDRFEIIGGSDVVHQTSELWKAKEMFEFLTGELVEKNENGLAGVGKVKRTGSSERIGGVSLRKRSEPLPIFRTEKWVVFGVEQPSVVQFLSLP